MAGGFRGLEPVGWTCGRTRNTLKHITGGKTNEWMNEVTIRQPDFVNRVSAQMKSTCTFQRDYLYTGQGTGPFRLWPVDSRTNSFLDKKKKVVRSLDQYMFLVSPMSTTATHMDKMRTVRKHCTWNNAHSKWGWHGMGGWSGKKGGKKWEMHCLMVIFAIYMYFLKCSFPSK